MQEHHCDTTTPDTHDRPKWFQYEPWRQRGVHISSSGVCKHFACPFARQESGDTVNDSPTTTSPTPTRVVSNQLLCQLDLEGLGIGEMVGAGVVIHQDSSNRKVKMHL